MRKTNFNWLRCCLAGMVMGIIAGASAQQTAPAPVSGDSPVKKAAKIDEETKAPAIPGRDSFDLTLAQDERFRKLLPKTLVKLTNRERFHIVALGDLAVEMTAQENAEDAVMKSCAAVFATELANQFYYTGGVRVIRPLAVKPAAAAAVRPRGPEITLRSLAGEGRLMIHAMQMLTTYGFESQPDLVLVSFGVNDAVAGVNPATYAKALQEVITTVRSRGSELILVGPTLTVADPAEESMGLTRGLLDTMREVAADSGLLFVDPGDLSSLVAVSESISEPVNIFEQIVKQYRRFFAQSGTPDFIHPLPEMSDIIGRNIFTVLTSGIEPSPWSVTSGTATLESADKFALRYDLKNPSDKEVSFSVLPLVVREWKPVDAEPQVTLQPGETRAMQVSFARRHAGSGAGFPSHEPILRLPLLISGAGMTRIEDVRAEFRPFSLLWKLDAMFNQDKSFAPENLLCNTTEAPLKGTWSAEWLGQKRSGTFDIPAGGKEPLALSFDLPTASETLRQTGPVTMEIDAAGLKARFDRGIEATRNIGLKQVVSLTPLASAATGAAAGESPAVRMKADADANALYLIYEISGFNLEDAGENRSAFEYDLRLDARSYGKRLGFGVVDALRLSGRAADGVYAFESPPPWTFGTGYAAVYDPRFIRGQLSSSGSGMRRFTVTLPRSYLYLHEWAIGNGNSQLGIRTDIAFWKGPREGSPGRDFPRDHAFSLVSSDRHPDEAEGLAVLELTDKPTLRWTVNPF